MPSTATEDLDEALEHLGTVRALIAARINDDDRREIDETFSRIGVAVGRAVSTISDAKEHALIGSDKL
jgi:ABC-type uncharacterized transport system ATPase subunit